MLASGRLGRSAILLLAMTLAACEPTAPVKAPASNRHTPSDSTERAYHPPPAVTGVETSREGRVALSGTAEPGARVRLAMPDGRAMLAHADAKGRWRIGLPADSGMRFFSLSMIDGGRTVQSAGYVAVAPEAAALLRAGAGAEPLFGSAGGPRLFALDFDRKGGAVVTAQTAPGEPLQLMVDGTRRASGRAGPDGRFVAALNEPLAPGEHRLDLIGQRGSTAASADVFDPAPLPAIPLRAERLAGAWRIDWTTPGGGLQSTVLFTGGGA